MTTFSTNEDVDGKSDQKICIFSGQKGVILDLGVLFVRCGSADELTQWGRLWMPF